MGALPLKITPPTRDGSMNKILPCTSHDQECVEPQGFSPLSDEAIEPHEDVIDEEKDRSEGPGDGANFLSAQSSDQPLGFKRHHGVRLHELPLSPPASTHLDSSDDNSTQEQRRRQRREKIKQKKATQGRNLRSGRGKNGQRQADNSRSNSVNS
ncbi:hypothetical protein AMTR_s03490p00000280 [Amborella trichopoda]|uniref:Uncharacterized protein n=1 Tax=Amborella trichopoda TaxID=13333 RepID=U5CVV4_AMBTC|nr:hypothetical protein AMTR_s03490p00000280 [Amborella trichopoda]